MLLKPLAGLLWFDGGLLIFLNLSSIFMLKAECMEGDTTGVDNNLLVLGVGCGVPPGDFTDETDFRSFLSKERSSSWMLPTEANEAVEPNCFDFGFSLLVSNLPSLAGRTSGILDVGVDFPGFLLLVESCSTAEGGGGGGGGGDIKASTVCPFFCFLVPLCIDGLPFGMITTFSTSFSSDTLSLPERAKAGGSGGGIVLLFTFLFNVVVSDDFCFFVLAAKRFENLVDFCLESWA